MKRILKFASYSLGNFANTIAYQVFGNRIQFYYVDILGLNAGLAGILWFIYGFWNMVNDPLMGQVSDRTRSRFGRRVPYVALGAVPLGLSFFFLWTPPHQPPWLLAAYFLALLFIFDTLYSLVMVAYNALFPEVAPTPRDRVDLSATREILATFALLIAFIMAPIIAERVGYIWMGVIMGLLVAAGYLASMVGVKEAPIPKDEKQIGIWHSLKVVLGSVPFRWFLGANIAKEYIWLVIQAQLPFWRKYVLGIQAPIDVFGLKLGGGDAEAVLLGLPIVLTIPALLMWRPLVVRLGYRKTWIIASLAFIPGLLVMALAHDFYTGLLGTLLAVPGLAGSMIMPFPLISEIIEDDAKKEHGYKREGLFFGMNHGIVKLSFPIQGALFALILPAAGYVSGQAVQSAGAVSGIRFMIGGTSIIASLVIVICMYFYPLGRKSPE